MRIAVSNIAWPTEQDDAVADTLANAGVKGIEVAPTKVWPFPLDATDVQLDAYRRHWEARGIAIIGAQALLFGRPELTLFDDAETRQQTLNYLSEVIRICGRLGAQALVFGSPKNRRIGERNRATVWQEAVDFFRRLGEVAVRHGTMVVIEANPTEYGADFITHAADALRLVQAVDHPGCRLHLDAACMKMADDDPTTIIPAANGMLAHFHASEPYLAPLGQGTIDHASFAAPLKAVGYSGWISIEMRQTDPFDVRELVRAVKEAQRWYG